MASWTVALHLRLKIQVCLMARSSVVQCVVRCVRCAPMCPVYGVRKLKGVTMGVRRCVGTLQI